MRSSVSSLLSRSSCNLRSDLQRSIRNQRRKYSAQPSRPNVGFNAALAASFLAAAAGLYYYETRSSSSSSTTTTKNGTWPTTEFSVRARQGGVVQEFKFQRKSHAEVETALTEHQRTQTYRRRGNPVSRVDTNWVGSNEPCEDRSAIDLIPRSIKPKTKGSFDWLQSSSSQEPVLSASTDVAVDRVKAPEATGNRDLMFFSVLDGHAGSATSELLSKVLHPTLTLSMAGLEAGYLPNQSWREKMFGYFQISTQARFEPENVARTLQYAFQQLDHNICQTPINYLQSIQQGSTANEVKPNETFIALAEPASSGACAITALVDAENDGLYVALAGDCRAVAGWQGKDGKWRCDVLTEDQMGENPREIARMKSEHPASEADTVIMHGRIQGGLQPTRAFGDAVYKWTKDQAAAVASVYRAEGKNPRPQRPHSLTPPYCTAKPEVTYRRLRSENGESLKYIIMATDGLWDMISSEEAAFLTSAYIAHPKHPDVTQQSLPSVVQFAGPPQESDRLYPAQPLPGTPSSTSGGWVFEGDTNAATHLIRNSLAGADRQARAELLSLKGDISRRKRDDVTVTVVFFDTESDTE